MFYSTQGHDVGPIAEIFGSAGEHFGGVQLGGADDFPQERGFFLVGLDQDEMGCRSPDFYRQAGQAGSGAHIHEARGLGLRRCRDEQMPRCEY